MKSGRRYKGVVFDLDGVIWRDYVPTAHAAYVVGELQKMEISVAFLTNTSSRTTEFLQERLAEAGIEASEERIFTSARLCARYLFENHGSRLGRIVAIGSNGVLLGELRGLGLDATSLRDSVDAEFAEDDAITVVLGYTRDFGYEDVEHLLKLSPRVTRLFAAERDRWYGAIDGRRPGAGWVVAAAEVVLGRTAQVLGKPSPNALAIVSREMDLSAKDLLMVGDSRDSDIVAAAAANVASCLFIDSAYVETDSGTESRDYPEPTYQAWALRDILQIVKGRVE